MQDSERPHDPLSDRPEDITELIRRHQHGDAHALDDVFRLCARDLRRMASGLLRGERHAQTLQPTALVHEAFLRLFDGAPVDWEDRQSFLASAAREMRRTLTDHARARLSLKRGGVQRRVELDEAVRPVDGPDLPLLLSIDAALTRLAQTHPRAAAVVEMRFVLGLTVPEIAAALETTTRTVERDWAYARARLYGELASEPK
jgi:RNA polymerase sigma factor (TIGR02999 family)